MKDIYHPDRMCWQIFEKAKKLSEPGRVKVLEYIIKVARAEKANSDDRQK